MPAVTLKMIQVNIWKGRFLDALVAFLKKENPDIITLQEVTAGKDNFYSDKRLDIFLYLQKILGMRGAVAPEFRFIGDTFSYQGNALLVKGNVATSTTVWLYPYAELPDDYENDEPLLRHLPRNILDATVHVGGKKLHVLSVHGAWNRDPIDTPENLRQAKLIVGHIKTLHGEPFLLGGDLNMPPGSRVIKMIDTVARNILEGSGVASTLHPTIHKTAKEKPKGLLVDYIYTSSHFTVKKIDVPVVAVSDHLPVRATLSYDDI